MDTKRLEVAPTGKKRLFYLDLIRAIACILVISAHASVGRTFSNFHSPSFVVATIIEKAPSFCVDLFFMISGAMFLDEKKEYPFAKIKKNVEDAK